ncbi:helix-turn-helix domain-containing protein [Thalassobaculum salexigens]|uniref:helix-turn-helix domain-containing protein n=1 Tax=Thalassobaculum salexigens TaxID=455360 RepID=UPI00248E0D83|nr:XRE family transcriptional regulator [Thalassobaculum salexigens]
MPFDDFTPRLADRLKRLRQEAGWSLDTLAKRSGVSRATLSRMENAEVSPSAEALGKLCAAYRMPMSRLIQMVEQGFAAKVPAEAQAAWHDPATGFARRAVSPPAEALRGEVIEGTLPAGARIAYEVPPVEGLEHHLVMQSGGLTLTVDGADHVLGPGDCLRYRLHGPTVFQAGPDAPARYLLFLV